VQHVRVAEQKEGHKIVVLKNVKGGDDFGQI
jgi:hypothetical protein